MLSKSQISFIKSLHQKKHRVESGLFLAEGVKIISELIRSSFSIKRLYCVASFTEKFQALIQLSRKNIEIVTVSDNELEKISLLQKSQQALAIVGIPQAPDQIAYPLLVLDNIQDPGNMGTLIRIADWFGLKTVIASPETVEWQNPKVIQATMGSFLRVPVKVMPLADFFKQNKARVYGAVLDGKSIYEEIFVPDGAILMGNESKGIDSALEAYIDQRITIPSFGQAESLNVAIAAAVICSEMNRRNIRNSND